MKLHMPLGGYRGADVILHHLCCGWQYKLASDDEDQHIDCSKIGFSYRKWCLLVLEMLFTSTELHSHVVILGCQVYCKCK